MRLGLPSRPCSRRSEERNPDLVVLGTRGTPGSSICCWAQYRRARRAALADCPVLTIHPGDVDQHRRRPNGSDTRPISPASRAGARSPALDLLSQARAPPHPSATSITCPTSTRSTAPSRPLSTSSRTCRAKSEERLRGAGRAAARRRAVDIEDGGHRGLSTRGDRRGGEAIGATSTSSPWAPTAAPASLTCCSAAPPERVVQHR